jgi:hypothetical protein
MLVFLPVAISAEDDTLIELRLQLLPAERSMDGLGDVEQLWPLDVVKVKAAGVLFVAAGASVRKNLV